LKIALGGTARNPEDVAVLHDLRLEFAEIPIANLIYFKKNINKFLKLKEKTGLYCLCHGPREGNPNNIDSLKRDYLPQLCLISIRNVVEIMKISIGM